MTGKKHRNDRKNIALTGKKHRNDKKEILQ
jgi:hypothetical protein